MPARVAELVDARDLKSLGYFTCAGSIPASGITNPPLYMVGFLFAKFSVIVENFNFFHLYGFILF